MKRSGLVDAASQFAVALGQRGTGHEGQVPAMHLVQIRIAATGEGAQQVQRAGGLKVAGFHALRIGHALGGGEGGAVDGVAPIGGQGDAVHSLAVGGARFGVLACHAAQLHDGDGGAKGQDDGHLQQHAKGVADDVCVELAEAFGAVTALQDEGMALGGLAERCLQPTCLAGEDQRRVGLQAPLDSVQGGCVRVGGKLAGGVSAPGGG